MDLENALKTAADIIKKSNYLIALTGAGISVESGIPDFRSAGGLWEKYDPAVYAHIDSFRRNPEMIWEMLFDMIDLTKNARPNPAHIALAELEKKGILKAVITQNIDNLHQEAGSLNVIEFHGNAHRLECLECHYEEPVESPDFGRKPPRCPQCGKIMKPQVVFFGEMIPPDALLESQMLANSADAILVVGTSAVVYPASSIPYIAKQNRAKVIEMNVERTAITGSITDVFIQGKVGHTLPRLLELVCS
ncbi:MAG: NAD-dependent deacylase [Spirochaetes bacterium]|nr:NAD-dependent deacylase [Spirochaetota bacterium]